MTRAEELLIKEMRYIASISNGQVKRVAEGAITAAREYLATEPSSERAELIEELRSRVVGDPFPLMDRAADMLEDDAQPKSFIRERAQLDQEWCELQKLKQAQQAKRVPMTMAEITSAWGACIDNRNRVFEIRTEFARAIEAHHGIPPAEKPTDWSAACAPPLPESLLRGLYTPHQLIKYGKACAEAERDACASISPNGLSVLASDSPHAVWKKYSDAIKARSAA